MTDTSRDIAEVAREAIARFNALSPERQAEHRRLQRESLVRGLTTPCEHGVLDFEQCVACRPELKQQGSNHG